MVEVRSNLSILNNHKEKEEALVTMVRDEILLQDVEEGEISDSGSIKEIVEDGFKKADSRVFKPNGGSYVNNTDSNARVWTTRDVYRYPISSGYASGLYNLAWARAVQNKPLDEIFVKIDPNENLKPSLSSSSNTTTLSSRNNTVDPSKDAVKIISSPPEEEEEGELEEGEIDRDFEPIGKPQDSGKGDLVSTLIVSGEPEVNLKEDEQVTSILEALKTVTLVDAEK